jgi:hypothetical protein
MNEPYRTSHQGLFYAVNPLKGLGFDLINIAQVHVTYNVVGTIRSCSGAVSDIWLPA